MSCFLNFSLEESTFLLNWGRLFGVRSAVWRAAEARLFARRNASEFRTSFAFWSTIWRTTSGAADVDDEIDTFALQTFAAQSFLAICADVFETSDAELRALFGATPFDWGDAIRPELAPAAREAAEALQLSTGEFSAFAPFGECYARLFSANRRRKLGEFYTPAPLADYLRDRAFDFWRETSSAEPTVLDPTCGGGVFLASVLRRRVASRKGTSATSGTAVSSTSPAEVLNGIAGFDASPLAVLTARANLLFGATANVPASERPAELRRIVAARRAERPNEPILPIFLLDAVQNRVPSAAGDETGRESGLKIDENEKDERGRERVLAPDYFDLRRWARSPEFGRRFDVVLGNPPWIAWDKTSSEYRVATRRYWSEFGLFSLSGKEARLGGGKKELASLIFAATVERRLASGGVLAFVLPKSLFQTRKAGDGFRRFGSDATDFRVLQIDDFSEIDVFSNVLSKVATCCVRKGEKTRFPVPIRIWRATTDSSASGAKKRPFRGVAIAESGIATPISERPGAPLRFEATSENVSKDASKNEPIAAERLAERFSSASAASSRRRDALVERTFAANEALKKEADRAFRWKNGAPPDYVARLGANAAGGSGVFWLERVGAPENGAKSLVSIRNLGDVGKKRVESVAAQVEAALVFPLLRWRDVDEFFAAEPSTSILLPQDPKTRRGIDEKTMRRDFPAALSYLSRFENELRDRAAFRKFQRGAPFWSLYNVDASTFAPIKVVWRRIDSVLRAAVVENDAFGRPIIPQETLSVVAVASLDEADYLAATLNSAPIRERVAATSVPGSKSFGSPGILGTLGIPRFQADVPEMRELAELGRDERLKRRGEKIEKAGRRP